jgi:hypothetical protein
MLAAVEAAAPDRASRALEGLGRCVFSPQPPERPHHAIAAGADFRFGAGARQSAYAPSARIGLLISYTGRLRNSAQ